MLSSGCIIGIQDPPLNLIYFHVVLQVNSNTRFVVFNSERMGCDVPLNSKTFFSL